MQLRDAIPDDVDDLIAICAAAGGEVGASFERDLAHVREHGRLVIAVHDGRRVGFAGVIDLPATAFVTDLFVAPDHQGRGIATALMVELLRDRPVRTTFSSSHPAAIRAHARMGMRPRWRLRYLEGVVPSDVPFARAGELDVATIALERPSLWRHLRDVGARIVALPGAAVAAVVDEGATGAAGAEGAGSAGRVARVLRLATGDAPDHGADDQRDDAERDRRAAATLRGLWQHVGPGRRLLVHVREDAAIAHLLDAAGFVEIDVDTCCSTLLEPFPPGEVCFHPGLA